MVEPIKAIWAEIRDDPWIRCTVSPPPATATSPPAPTSAPSPSRGGVSAGRGPLSEEVHWSPRQNRVWKPTVTAVNGMVAGAGFHFVVDADIIVAAEHAVFLDTHVNVGMVGAIENIGLAKRLPLGSALRMTLCGKKFRMPAERAYQLGLVDEVVPADKLMETADEIAHQIAANSPAAVQLSMQAIWGSLEMPYTQAMEYGWALLRMHWDHPDFKEGPRAFAEKREPGLVRGPRRGMSEPRPSTDA